MLFRTLPKTLDLLGVRSPALLTHATGRREVTRTLHKVAGHTNPWGPAMTQASTRVTGVTGQRFLSAGGSRGSRDPGDYSQDPQVKEWLKELQKDFSHQPEGGKEKEEGAGMKEKKEQEVKEGKERGEAADRIQESEKETKTSPHKVWSQLVAEKYEKMDTHMQVIYDYDEERLRREEGLREEEEEEKREKVEMERGETGVFDIEELVDLLREDNAQDIVAIQVPPELKYVSYMVIVSSASSRHRTALAELVRAAYKLKKDKKDHSVIMEGKGTDWVAMDMGNIALHIMKPETREMYDLETLWAVGAEFDEKAQVSEEDLLTVRRPRDPLARPLPSSPMLTSHAEAVT